MMDEEMLPLLIAYSNEFFPEESKTISLQELLDFIEHYRNRK